MSSETAAPASVSTHILDTSVGRPAEGVALTLSVRSGSGGAWTAHGAGKTDADGRCKDLPALPADTTHVRIEFDTEAYFSSSRHGVSHQHSVNQQAEEQQDAPALRDSGAFFPEVAITFAVKPGEHYHVPLLLNPFGYSVYRGS
ncbi:MULTISPECIES: hydroxyisourate hydrolase [unclassified Streptomyces]|uniref:hydroxyisourate hydrolase n=1 Tax=unclassified Streptomyces TaxID=2593676 RepID=UPI000367370E|nr:MULTISPECIES: hydroxyisourate hydrolase [unclassified Streptomyces]MYT30450.1 hydroxyisourate hydrolase [Streptomyces sp. SID8354]